MSDDVYMTLRCRFDRHSLCTTPQLATCQCECHDLTLDLHYEDAS